MFYNAGRVKWIWKGEDENLCIRELKIILLIQTTWIEKMISHNKFDKKIKKIYYFYPSELSEPPVKERVKVDCWGIIHGC